MLSRIFILTYNINNDSNDIIKFLEDAVDDSGYDCIYIALQENYRTKTYNQIENALKEKYKDIEYFVGHKMLGISSFLISRIKPDDNVLKIGLGLFSLPNKGFIAYKVDKTLLVNCHLEAHDHNKKKRLKMFKYVVNALYKEFNGFDTIIFSGDFNFRWPASKSETESEEIMKYQENSQKDEFIDVKKLFPRLSESEINFPPTYKYIKGSDKYDTSRSMSWCDRIFYVSNCRISVVAYGVMNSKFSDHRPVFAKINLDSEILQNDELLPHKKPLFMKSSRVLTNLYNSSHQRMFSYFLFFLFLMLLHLILYSIKMYKY